MSTKAAHAALPWRRGPQLGTIISDDARDFDEHYGGHLVCETCLKANTELIITAVNHHQELITRLYNLRNQAELVRESIINQPRFPNLSTHSVSLHGLPEAIRDAEETLKKVIQ
jgi:hypothetical protein